MKPLIKVAILSLTILSFCNIAVAQKKLSKEERIAKMVADKNFTFSAKHAFIRKESIIRESTALDYGFYFKITPDSVSSNLPYYGNATNASDYNEHSTSEIA